MRPELSVWDISISTHALVFFVGTILELCGWSARGQEKSSSPKVNGATSQITEKAQSRDFGLFVSSPYSKNTSVVNSHGLKKAAKLAYSAYSPDRDAPKNAAINR
jgi:hypothetical protein